MGNVIVVASGKGGTGKTLFTSNLGAVLAMRGKRVVLVDMDMGLRNLDLYLGLESKVVYNVMDVLSGMCRIKQALIRDKRFESLYLIAASPNRDERDITELHMQILCEKLGEAFDYIIIDAPAGIGEGFELAAAAAEKAVVVTEADTAAIRDADVVDRELIRLGIEQRYCVFNKVKGDLMSMGVIPGISSVSRGIRMNVAGIIQYDDNILVSATRGVPIVMKEDSYITQNMERIADRILAGV
ncbi:MAG: septum site-determining protein MinD [Clostridiales bacterium]|nr:septum site-determining protein MinD [Clostridiales bacterium]